MKFKIVILFILLNVTLQAYVSSDGNVYEIRYNKHGAVLTSTYKHLTLYLGKDCDAFSKVYGKGTWGWANGGFSVDFRRKSFGFGRQELDLDRVRGMVRCRLE